MRAGKKTRRNIRGSSFRVFELMTWRVGIGFWCDWTVLMGFMKIGWEGGPLMAHEIPDKQRHLGLEVAGISVLWARMGKLFDLNIRLLHSFFIFFLLRSKRGV